MNRQEVNAAVTGLAIGMEDDTTSTSEPCPVCSVSGSFSLTKRNGQLLFICHRASCGVAGIVDIGLQRTERGNRADLGATRYRRPWERELAERVSIPPRVLEALLVAHGLMEHTLTNFGCKWMPLFNTSQFNGRLWIPFWNGSGEMVGGTARSLERDSPKNITIKLPGHTFGMAKFQQYSSTVVLVEDVLSAMRLRQDSNLAVICLNGTSLTEDRVLEIARQGYPKVVLALDADATELALKYSFRYNSVLPLFVKYLPKDIKDMNNEELNEWCSSIDTVT